MAVFVAVSLVLVGPTTASGAVPSPPFAQCPAIGSDTSCAILIVINPDGSRTNYVDPNQGAVDGSDDSLVGVQNASAATVSAVPITGDGIFGFDGDGLCTLSSAPAGCPFGTTGYEGPNSTFNVTDSSGGSVAFPNGLAAGESTYFSLEGPTTSVVATIPAAVTGQATTVSDTAATLTGSVNPNGADTTYHFDYGVDQSYGMRSPDASLSATPNDQGNPAQSVSAALSGLAPGTTYHFRLSATNSIGTTNGDDQAFTTAAAAAVTCGTLHQLKNLASDSFALRSAVPGPLSFPFGVDVTPGIALAASVTNLTIGVVGSTIAVQAVNPGASPATIASIDPVTFNGGLSGAAPSPLFGGSPSPDVSFLGAPSFDQDKRAAFPLSPLVALPIVTAGIAAPVASATSGGAVISLCLNPNVVLHIRFYPFQAAVYALTKAAENLAGDLATGGVGAPVVAAIVELQIASNVAEKVVDLTNLIATAKGKWGAAKLVAKLEEKALGTVTSGLEDLLKKALGAGAKAIGDELSAAEQYFRRTVVVAFKAAIVRPITVVYDGGKRVFDAGGRLVTSLGAGVRSSTTWTVNRIRGLFSLAATPAPVAFDALPVALLGAQASGRGAAGLGVGLPLLNRPRAISVGQLLMQGGVSRARIQRLLISRNAPQTGGGLSIAGARLGTGRYVTIELRGPGFAAERLVGAQAGVAAANLTLPAKLAPGTWSVAIINYNGVKRQGLAVADAYQWQVRAARRR